MKTTRLFQTLIVVLSLFISSCTTPGKKTGVGAGVGAGAGAVIGGIAGGWKGAGIGAVIGGVAGGAFGNVLDKRQKELNKVVETKKTTEGLLVNLKSELLFETGKTDLKLGAVQKLQELANVLKKYPDDQLNVGGFTDNVGSPEFNTDLAKRRADTVAAVLISNGIEASRVQSFGFGEATPIASNDTVAGRAQNRRVEINIIVPNKTASN